MPLSAAPPLTPFPTPAPQSGEDEDLFDEHQQAFVNAQTNFVPEFQGVIDWVGDAAEYVTEQAGAADTSAGEALSSQNQVTALIGGFNSGNQGSWPTVITQRNNATALQQGDTFFYTGATGGGYTTLTSYSWNSTLAQWEVAPVPGVFVTKTQLITASTTWTKPARFVPSSLFIDGIGSGSSGNSSSVGVGGGSGEYVICRNVDVSAVSSVVVTLNPGGAAVNGGGVNAAGNPGGVCSFGSLVVLSGGVAPSSIVMPASSVGGTAGGVADASTPIYAQSNPTVRGGVSGTLISSVSRNKLGCGGGGLVFDDTSTSGGSTTNTGGGVGYGAGGAASGSNTTASGYGAKGAFLLTWQEYQ
jgi:hypothetical protein